MSCASPLLLLVKANPMLMLSSSGGYSTCSLMRERPMASVSRLHPSRVVYTISSKLEAFLADAQERRGLGGDGHAPTRLRP